MAIVIEANYTKKLGLPGYSSHQYSVTLRTELADLTRSRPRAPGSIHCCKPAWIREIQEGRGSSQQGKRQRQRSQRAGKR